MKWILKAFKALNLMGKHTQELGGGETRNEEKYFSP